MNILLTSGTFGCITLIKEWPPHRTTMSLSSLSLMPQNFFLKLLASENFPFKKEFS